MMHRLRYLIRVVKFAPPVVHRLIFLLMKVPNTWPSQIVSDLKWIWNSIDEVHTAMPDPTSNQSIWFKDIFELPGKWSGIFKKAITLATTVCVRAISVDTASNHNVNTFGCEFCDVTFGTKHQMRSHMFDKHDYVNPLRLRAYTTMCLHCNTEFHTSVKLCGHLMRNTKHTAECAKWYMDSIDPMSVEMYRAKAAKDRVSAKSSSKLLPKPPVKIIMEEAV